MSELPDGLPNTCLDCVSTTVEDRGDGSFLLIAEKNGNKATMLADLNLMAKPLLEILIEQLDS